VKAKRAKRGVLSRRKTKKKKWQIMRAPEEALQDMLNEGWEPYAVIVIGGVFNHHLKRQKTVSK